MGIILIVTTALIYYSNFMFSANSIDCDGEDCNKEPNYEKWDDMTEEQQRFAVGKAIEKRIQ
ncbi:MAG: Conserved domain protein [Candidatus Midichloria mitochondrii]|nr:hypothetical protein [Candidatus Midichloria mitochondrii]MDJ1256550.1 hypothetical protein [Candidatus Midichloria mitochondrii]MDJ1299151.1 hypothetical protein [Candidatus Midichloria mitochondrii]MDJ1313286.1 hypothetical protein [Candidatus Midichloria mitochondrii]